MLRDLMAVETLAESLTATAPQAIAWAGGAQVLIAAHGRRSGAWFWTIAPMPDGLWERMAEEHQAKHRANVGGDD
ncbi:hypothetical protein SL003B_1709 [Polymorphum gilvum SL003B-26A1]|uniref:Uncharacterized protein n=2 Tax=Polymorphum TaxID=991903 RepID=F2J5Q3_POLGS|nr:hypothetical protein SL003B_1709 [Polymorphum gilvum SL003B-26A1]